MKIEGDYLFTASREIIWSMLFDPGMLQHAIPGCEHLDQLGPRQYDLTLRIGKGPLAGQYNGIIDLRDVVEYESMHITVVGRGPHGPLQAHGQITIVAADSEHVRLAYQGEVELNGRIPNQTTRLVQTTANAHLRQFFAAIEQQIQIQTNVYTTYTGSEPLVETAVTGQRRKGIRTIDTRDKLYEMSRNRRVLAIVVIFSLLNFLAFIGILVSGRTLIKWVKGYFAQQVAEEVNRERNNRIQ